MGAVVQQLLSFAIIFLITRLLGAKGYGEVVTLTAIAGTIFNFSAQWAQPYMIRTESINFAKTQKISSAFLIPALISLLTVFIVTYPITHYFAERFGDVSTIPASMVYVSAISFFIFQIAKTGLQVQSRFGYYGFLLSLDKIILLCLIGGLLAFNLLNNSSVLWAYVAGTLLAGIFGLTLALYKKHEWKQGGFVYREYIKSITPVSGSVFILYFSSITFVILLARPVGGAELVAWIGMGNVLLGILLQPFNWLAPTLSPKLSRDVLEMDGHERINNYLKDWVLPASLIILWVSIAAITVVLFTPILPIVLGGGFQGGVTIIALVAMLTTAEASNLMLVQIVYARKLETLVMVAVLFKSMPLLIGYACGASVELLLILLNFGSWLAICISLFGIRSYLQRKWVLQYAVLGATAFLASVMVTMPYSEWFLGGILIVMTLPAIRFLRQTVRMVGLGRGRTKAGYGV